MGNRKQDQATRGHTKEPATGSDQPARHGHPGRPGRCNIYRRRRKAARTYGALDLGTNNCRLLIARPAVDGFRVVTSFSRVVRLGQGLGQGLGQAQMLCEEAMNRTIGALKICAEKLAEHEVSRYRNVATEACRRAQNCVDFFKRIEAETGLKFETVTIQEEARLALAGCTNLLSDRKDFALVFDIGGGSTELIWACRKEDDDGFNIIDVLSLPLGVVTLAERCGTENVSPEIYTQMIAEAMDHLPAFCRTNGIGEKVSKGLVQMVGTSGTVTTLGAVYLDLPTYSRARIDGLTMKFDALELASRRLTELDYQGRAAIPCIGHERAELVVPGCAILEAICRHWPVGTLRVADRGLREGILLELMAADRRASAGIDPTLPQ